MIRQRFKRFSRIEITAYFFILPQIIGILIFLYYPAIQGLLLSFFDCTSTSDKTFIGLENFKNLFQDKIFLNSIFTMFKIIIPAVLIGVFVPLIMAELLNNVKATRFKNLYRVLILIPMIAPGVVSMMLWKDIYNPNNGLATKLAQIFGVVPSGAIVDWLGDPSKVIYSIIFIGFPWIGGTSVLIYLSGLMSIPSSLVEAASLDGCGTFKRILIIDIPFLMGQIRYFLIFGIIGQMQNFGSQIILTQGGPGFSTYVPGYYMYKMAFSNGKMGYASAIGTVMFIAIFAITIITFKFVRKDDMS